MPGSMETMAHFDPSHIKNLPRSPGIATSSETSLTALLKEHKLSESEYQRLEEIMGRPPTMAELGIFSAMWSEHCSYKSSRVHLRRFPTHGPNVVVGPGENAGVVRISGKLCAAFKMESHNHPSYLEPYQGAATGVGGILRDVFCMGARPIANLNALRFGSLHHPRTSHLLEYAVKGIGDYGNCIGVPTVGGSLAFDDSYNGNCLVNAMTVGLLHEDRIFKGFASGQGNLVIYVGSATGRDGIHGATMASDSFASGTSSSRTTVQVGDPFTEKLLLEATLEVLAQNLVVGLQDMGAAGLTSSSFEMAGRAGHGLFLDLDRVPVRTENMSAYELLLSESQERMLMVIKPENWPRLKSILDRWQLACTTIGIVTDTGRVQVHYQGVLEADVPVGPITDQAPAYERPLRPRPSASIKGEVFNQQVAQAALELGQEALLLSLLRAGGDKLPIYDQYDQHIGVRTVHGSAQQGAAVLWLRSPWAEATAPYLGLATAVGCHERYCRLQPRLGASHGVAKTARMITAVGGEPLAITDCLNYGNPEDPEVMWEFSEGVDGISDACQALNIQVVSGNVSLYNQTDGQSIAPTPMIGMVGRVPDVRLSPPATLSQPSTFFLLYPRQIKPSFGASLAAKVLGQSLVQGEVPPINWEAEIEAMGFIRNLISDGKVMAIRDVGDGGVLTTATKMVLNDGLGLTLDLSAMNLPHTSPIQLLFGELPGSYLLAAAANVSETLQQRALPLLHNSLTCVGEAHMHEAICWDGGQLDRRLAAQTFQEALVASDTDHS